MPVKALGKLIDSAVAAERSAGGYRAFLQGELPQLQQRLLLPEEGALAALLDFVIDYVEAVPKMLLRVRQMALTLGIESQLTPFIYLAEDYFLRPEETGTANSLANVLQEAFLAHRLMEEVNDYQVRHQQLPLLPIDMTEANIIVHHLLGDGRASRLEQLVHATALQQLQGNPAWPRGGQPGRGATQLALDGEPVLRGPSQVRLRLAI